MAECVEPRGGVRRREGGGPVESELAGTKGPIRGPEGGVIGDLGYELGRETEAGGEKPAG